ncbi:hypothetical protein A0H81_03980 [Grifola frondosa]|uniref:Uncharacterized protein n=1 Tax=Grifola frondosa TaxID=5627 RepID=A0A1C7MHN2_GRIFR|nr:hypothetical protein A0H81_03980 [Grifola frondosa]
MLAYHLGFNGGGAVPFTLVRDQGCCDCFQIGLRLHLDDGSNVPCRLLEGFVAYPAVILLTPMLSPYGNGCA